ncbi:endonuclease-reverse transcriptase [Plakobranchus ocellatus]|uniref:Endonuclease-reverse transcriptase n=1 Tax=Plakobranchus ocellatus TaxID=259542 RepID=A0AAV4CU50_9GAST|nr:endonuclease-reverse transcriptase [Plakobranchus ocellatus]
MTHGSQTWTLNKQLCHKLQTAQRVMERKMVNIKLKDRIPTIEKRKKTEVIDVVELKQDGWVHQENSRPRIAEKGTRSREMEDICNGWKKPPK